MFDKRNRDSYMDMQSKRDIGCVKYAAVSLFLYGKVRPIKQERAAMNAHLAE